MSGAFEADIPIELIECEIDINQFSAKRFRSNFAESGRIINYVGHVLESGFIPEIHRKSRAELLDNLYTEAVEVELAATVGRYDYDLNIDYSHNPPKLFSKFVYLDDYLDHAIDETNNIPEFELPRNQANHANYLKIQDEFFRNDKKFFVEFSPSPLDMEDQKVKDRGYWGQDSIFVYENQGSHISVSQHWFPKTEISKYQKLFNEIDAGKITESTDVGIMTKSLSVDESDLFSVNDFISGKKDNLHENNRSLQTQLKSEFKPRIDQIANQVFSIGHLYRSGISAEAISSSLEDLKNNLNILKFDVKVKVSELLGTVLDYADAEMISQYKGMTASQKSDFLDLIRFNGDDGCAYDPFANSPGLSTINTGFSASSLPYVRNASDLEIWHICECGWFLNSINIFNSASGLRHKCEACSTGLHC